MPTTRSSENLPLTAASWSTAWLDSFRAFARDIKLAHSIFALPFAACALLFVQTETWHAFDWRQATLLVLCMVSARSFAMGMNRYLDWRIDAKNPRTRIREIPKGTLRPKASLMWSMGAAILLVVGAFGLNPLAGWLAFPLLLILMSYSFGKRVSALVHWYLGMCLGFAPIAVQIALEGHVAIPVLLLGLAVTFWTAGFDVLYSLQDMNFDRSNGLKSVPAKFGTRGALWISRASFTAMILCLLSVYVLMERGVWFLAGTAFVAGVLIYEHWLVRDVDVDGRSPHINAAFFNWNATVSVAFFLFAWIDHVMGGR